MGSDEPLMISGLQHFTFCRRQWALIHVEQQWSENEHTVRGNLFHNKVHHEDHAELRGDKLTLRGLRVASAKLGITGVCDVVEFYRAEEGISLQGYKGLWKVYPVEYKKGKPKTHQADELQLCAEAMCLEEMLLCSIPEASLFYGEPRRRTVVPLTAELRDQVKVCLEDMHQYMTRGYTPIVKPHAGCKSCSLKELCLPEISERRSTHTYLTAHLRDDKEE